MKFERITINPDQMSGMPCIRGLRIPVATVVGMVADGMTGEEILRTFPDLEQEDVREALCNTRQKQKGSERRPQEREDMRVDL